MAVMLVMTMTTTMVVMLMIGRMKAMSAMVVDMMTMPTEMLTPAEITLVMCDADDANEDEHDDNASGMNIQTDILLTQ